MLLIPTCQRRSQVAVAAAIAVAAFLVAPTWAMAHTTSTLPASTADLLAKGGQLSPDGRWIHMPDGVDVSATPATLSDCTSGHVCLFDNANFVGTMLMFSAPGLYNLTDYD